MLYRKEVFQIEYKKLTKTPSHAVALVDARMTYPSFGVRVIVSDPKKHLFGMHDTVHQMDFMINSDHEDQKAAAQAGLASLMNALGLTVPSVVTQQPPQVVAAAYARALQRESWQGWLFSKNRLRLKTVKVKVDQGISKHHKKRYCNYTFNSTGQSVERKKVLVNGYDYDGWWRYNLIKPNQLSRLPDDFLLWFDADGKDRRDLEDARIVARALNINKKKVLENVFYQLKFEMADVICSTSWYGHTSANIPANIFTRDADSRDSLSGLIAIYRSRRGTRPSADAIYHAAEKDKLPRKAWNGKWTKKD
ncbi:hypothetical protein [Limosilactobacillus vaginalis]|uniref:hypothetical protein n=1 Tax=Limosilactobacillus vaginalis TaxID=1633 RepID=UPI0024BA9ACB|nr:hypothetical protein [Limosilactobacillus vaginalis]